MSTSSTCHVVVADTLSLMLIFRELRSHFGEILKKSSTGNVEAQTSCFGISE